VHTLSLAPLALRTERGLAFGSFTGGLPTLDVGASPRGPLLDFFATKRWSYLAFASDDLFIGCAVVSLSYASTALLFVADRSSQRMLLDESFVGGPLAARFSDRGHGARAATFTSRRGRLSVGDSGLEVALDRGARRVSLAVSAEAGALAPALGAVAPVAGGYVNATEKRWAKARAVVDLPDGDAPRRQRRATGLMGLDHTRGILARSTAWRWAFALGRATTGETVVLNLVEGFVGEPECAVWVDGELIPLGEGRFRYDLARPLAEWQLGTSCGAVDLRFKPFALHAEQKNLVLVRSHFLQPVGGFSGTVRLPSGRGGRTLFLDDVPGVTEHQDVVW
jgi:hypothetical protein